MVAPAAILAPLAALLFSTAPDGAAPRLEPAERPARSAPLLWLRIVESHRSMAPRLERLAEAARGAVEGRLAKVDVDAAAVLARDLLPHLSDEGRAFLPLLQGCPDPKLADSASDTLLADHRLQRSARRLIFAADQWHRYGDRVANRAHFAREALAVQDELALHVARYDALLAGALECLTAHDWEKGLDQLAPQPVAPPASPPSS